MASAIQYAVFLLLSFNVASYKQGGRCNSQPACFDLLMVERLAQKIGTKKKDNVATDSENILLKRQTFDKIGKKKYLHSCVLGKIFDFYDNILNYTWRNSSLYYISQGMNSHLELLYIMKRLRRCTYKTKIRCKTLYQKAAQQPILEIPEADMTSKEVAILQLQKLAFASKMLNDMGIQQRAMDELKSLHHYMSGRGFRKTTVLTKN